MKRLLNTGFLYAILAMVGGVFYREFTKYNDFTDKTMLSIVHVHLFMLGAMVFLLLTLFEKQFNITNNKRFNIFYYTYNVGLMGMVAMFVWHGIYQVLGFDAGGMIAGLAGLAHITLSVGIVFLFLILKQQVVEKTN